MVPEWAEEDYYGVPRVAPLRLWGTRTRHASAGRGGSFEVFTVSSNRDKLKADRPELLEVLRKRDVPLILIDRDDPSLPVIQGILREAAAPQEKQALKR